MPALPWSPILLRKSRSIAVSLPASCKHRDWRHRFIASVTLCLACVGSGSAQELQFTPITYLDGGEHLIVPDRGRPFLIPLDSGGWIAAGFQERWSWGEFGETGSLLSAHGRRWGAGAPGEFQMIDGVFPLSVDTLLVVEEHVITRVLTSGKYVDRRFVGFATLAGWTRLADGYLLGGYGDRGGAVSFLRIWNDGRVRTLEMPRPEQTDDQTVSAHPVHWNGDIWVWLYPRGPFHRLDLETGRSLEAWSPPLPRGLPDDWRGILSAGPGGTTILWEWLESKWFVFDRDRDLWFSQDVPDHLRAARFLNEQYAYRAETTHDPLPFTRQVRIFRYSLADGETDR